MTEKERKLAYIQALADMPEIVIATAFACARCMVDYGVDVSEKWETVTHQRAALNMAYQRGRYDEQRRIFGYKGEDG